MNNSKRFVINNLPDFPNFILEAKNTKELQDYIIKVCTYIADAKELEIMLKIDDYFKDKIIQGQQNFESGCWRFTRKELVLDLKRTIEN